MANSYIEYTGNGVRDTYIIPFGFLADGHINVKLDDVETSDFDVIGVSVVLDEPAGDGVVVRIYRLTPRTQMSPFTDGADPSAEEKNRATLQLLYIAQELEDGTISGTPEIGNNSLTLSKLQSISSGKVLARKSSSAGDVEAVTTAELATMIGLSTVATSGSYDDLGDKPTIPTNGTGLALSGGNMSWQPNVQSMVKSDTFSGTSTSWAAITGLEKTISVVSASNRVNVDIVLSATSSGSSEQTGFRLTRNGTVIAVGDAGGNRTQCTATLRDGMSAPDEYCPKSIPIRFVDTPGAAGAVVYAVQYRMLDAGTLYLNRGAVDNDVAPASRTISTIILTELPA